MDHDRISRRTWLAGMSLAAARLSAAEPEYWTLAQAALALERRTISSEELTRLCLARIRKLDPKLNSFITVTEDRALAQARICDSRRPQHPSPLFGVPIALKANIDTAGVRT